MARAFFGGIHLEDHKAATNKKPSEPLAPAPAVVTIPLQIAREEPCRPLVAAGDRVKIGQKIGECNGLGVPVYASVSGTVKAIEPRRDAEGGMTLSAVIENDMENTVSETVKAPENFELLTPEEMIALIREAGIVGLGGSPNLTYAKIASGLGRVRTVIVNGAECEPYRTADHRLMLECPEDIVGGAGILARIFGVNKVIIGIESNKRNAIALLRAVAERDKAPLEVHPLPRRYPQGGERQICRAITGRQVPPNGTAADIGCAVFNVATVRAIFRAVTMGMPLVECRVTVAGSGVIHPKNVECPVGTPISDLLTFCGGVKERTYKLIVGGAMMGRAQYTADVPVTLGTGAVLAFCGNEGRTSTYSTCIRCGRCVDACPMHLEPLFLYRCAQRDMLDALREANAEDCIECGACDYVCPGRLHLTQMLHTAKKRLADAREKEETV